MTRLIHNGMTVSTQFEKFREFNETVDEAWRVHANPDEYENINRKRDFVEEKFGISCKVLWPKHSYMGARLVEPRIVNEKKCLFYLISIQ